MLGEPRMKLLRVGLVLTAIALPACGGRGGPLVVTETQTIRTEERQRAQEQQIREAAAAGRIDPHHAQRLLTALQRIQSAQERAYSDGILTLREQRRLEHQQNRLQRHIDRVAMR